MRCPLCDGKTRVTVTRTGDNPKGYVAVREVRAEVSRFTSDWVCRLRVCSDDTCTWRAATVELYLADLQRGWVRKDPHIRQLLRTRGPK